MIFRFSGPPIRSSIIWYYHFTDTVNGRKHFNSALFKRYHTTIPTQRSLCFYFVVGEAEVREGESTRKVRKHLSWHVVRVNGNSNYSENQRAASPEEAFLPQNTIWLSVSHEIDSYQDRAKIWAIFQFSSLKSNWKILKRVWTGRPS